MFVEAFSPSHGPIAGLNVLPILTPIPCLYRRRTGSLMATVASEATPSSPSIVYNEELQRHTVTIPSFDEENTDSYPSLLHKIHIQPLLSNKETTTLLNKARDYATENSSWDQQDSSRHVAYRTVDFAIEESIEISQYLGEIAFEDRTFGALSEVYDVDADDMSFLDLFVASYEGKDDATDEEVEERNTMDQLDFHRDGSLLSFTVLLSPTEDFEGGGTIFDALGDAEIATKDDGTHSILQSPGVIQSPQPGYATLHSGKLLHGGNQVTKGHRIVLVGFVDVHERNTKPGAYGSATKEWGRNDVREFWNKRRLSLLQQQQGNDYSKEDKEAKDQLQPVWKLKNWIHRPKHTTSSYFGEDRTIPTNVLKNMETRASIDKIRKRRLVTEDRLLREILLPREERGEKIDDEGEAGEWMEVDMDSLGMDGLMLGWDNEEEEEDE